MTRALVTTCVLSAVLATAGAAQAGTCPTDKVLKTPRKIESKDSVAVTRETLATVKLAGWRNVGELFLRTRRLTIGPRGIVPTHEHDDRPSIVYIVSGELIEHSSYCSVPIRHKAGEWTPEFGPGHAHWWENPTNKPAVVTSSDVVDQETIDLDLPKASM
ncbi:cupin [uncultured Alsobacter sp.]|uniref:cupin n=1 Tax=uncultured Alsobacter sp. TaxID=1748258 RepID=UPI0025DDB8DE|nr:cupin [uncultured Alsobacter sp.]